MAVRGAGSCAAADRFSRRSGNQRRDARPYLGDDRAGIGPEALARRRDRETGRREQDPSDEQQRPATTHVALLP